MLALFARRIGALAALLAVTASPAFASEAAEGGPPNLLDPNLGVMAWTLVIFVLLLVVLSKFAFKPIFAAVEAREKALEDAIEGAKRDRAAAESLLAQQKAHLETARTDAQQIVADSRATAEKMRTDLLALTKSQQEEMIEQASCDRGREGGGYCRPTHRSDRPRHRGCVARDRAEPRFGRQPQDR